MSTSQPAVEDENSHLSHATPSVPTKPPSRRNSFIGTIGNGVGGAPKSPTHRHSRTNSPRCEESSGAEVILGTSDGPVAGSASDSALHQVRRGTTAAVSGETASSSSHVHSSNEHQKANDGGGGLGLPSASSPYPSPLVLVDMSKASPAEPLVGGGASLSQSERINNNTNTNAALSFSDAANVARDVSLANDTNADKLLVAQNIGQRGSDAVQMPKSTMRSCEGGVKVHDWQATTTTNNNTNNNAHGNGPAVSSSSKQRKGGAALTPSATPPSTPIVTAIDPSTTANTNTVIFGTSQPTTTNAVASSHTHRNSTELSPIPVPAAQQRSSGGAYAGTTARPQRPQGGIGPAHVPSVRPPLSSITGLERVAAIPKLQGSSDRMKERVGTCVHNLMAARCPERLHTYAEVMRLYEGKEEVLLDALQTVFGDEHFYGGGGIRLGREANNQQEIVNRLLNVNDGYAGRVDDLLGGGATTLTSFHASATRRRSQSPNTTATLFSESAKGTDKPSTVNVNSDIAQRSHDAFAQRMGVGTVVEQHQQQNRFSSSAATSTAAPGHGLPSTSIAVAAHTSTFSRTGAILTPPLPKELMIGAGAGTMAMQQRASSGLAGNPTNPTNSFQVRAEGSVSRPSSYRRGF